MAKNRLVSYYLGISDNKPTDYKDYGMNYNEGKGQRLKVGIAKGIELCNPEFDFDAYDEECVMNI